MIRGPARARAGQRTTGPAPPAAAAARRPLEPATVQFEFCGVTAVIFSLLTGLKTYTHDARPCKSSSGPDNSVRLRKHGRSTPLPSLEQRKCPLRLRATSKRGPGCGRSGSAHHHRTVIEREGPWRRPQDFFRGLDGGLPHHLPSMEPEVFDASRGMI